MADTDELTEDAPLTAEERRRQSNRDSQRRYRQRLSAEQATAQRETSNTQRRARYAGMSDVEREEVRREARVRYAADAERQREGARRRYDADRPLRRAQNAAWKAAHPEQVRELGRRGSRAWRRRNPAKVKAAHADYRERHRERFRLYWRQRKARRRGAACCDPVAHRDYALILLSDPCSYCGAEGDAIDHIVAITRGGSDEWENLTAACGRCNSRKYDKSVLETLLCLN